MRARDWAAGDVPHPKTFAFLDEGAKKDVRRALLKAVAIPGYQVPYGSREMPLARGWGTGGIQVTLSMLLPEDVVKVIDQGCDGSVNAVNIKKFYGRVGGVGITTDTAVRVAGRILLLRRQGKLAF